MNSSRCWFYQAVAHDAHGEKDKAVQLLSDALTLAEPDGFIRIFVDEGPPMARLLSEALSPGIAPDYVRQLSAAFSIAEPVQTIPSKSQRPESEFVEPLSNREIEVLQLISEGLTNQEIATNLAMSLYITDRASGALPLAVEATPTRARAINQMLNHLGNSCFLGQLRQRQHGAQQLPHVGAATTQASASIRSSSVKVSSRGMRTAQSRWV